MWSNTSAKLNLLKIILADRIKHIQLLGNMLLPSRRHVAMRVQYISFINIYKPHILYVIMVF